VLRVLQEEEKEEGVTDDGDEENAEDGESKPNYPRVEEQEEAPISRWQLSPLPSFSYAKPALISLAAPSLSSSREKMKAEISLGTQPAAEQSLILLSLIRKRSLLSLCLHPPARLLAHELV